MERPDNLVIVIFGATGDLTSRKLLPALYSLSNQKLMPEKFALLGVGRSELTSAEFRKKIEESIMDHSEEIEYDFSHIPEFTSQAEYFNIDYASVSDYKKLRSLIESLCKKNCLKGNLIFYLATPPSIYEVISTNLSQSGLEIPSNGFRRFIFEKPFGYDLESSRKLNMK